MPELYFKSPPKSYRSNPYASEMRISSLDRVVRRYARWTTFYRWLFGLAVGTAITLKTGLGTEAAELRQSKTKRPGLMRVVGR